jgi:vacuolar-type H+-ATPase subunit H
MLPTFFLYSTIVTNIVILLFALYYSLQLRQRESRLEKKEQRVDTDYHHVVDEALSQERQILGDATTEADKIITGAQYINHNARQEIDAAIKVLVQDIQKEAATITNSFTSEYSSSLKQLTSQSLTDFQSVMKQLQLDLQQQIKTFHESLLPEVEKELESYKQTRMKAIDSGVVNIVQKASQEIFNRSLSLRDHQELLMQALEKAKKEGVFD